MRQESYEVRAARPVRREIEKLQAQTKARVMAGLRKVAATAASGKGERGGKSVKKLQGKADRFFRLRVGDYRVMYDVLDEERVVLVLGVVHRRDLDRWLRSR